MKYFMIYITAGSYNEAKRIADILLRKKLVACVNIIPKIESAYWWKGKVEKSSEVGMIAKTNNKHVNEVIKKVKEVHSDSTPCIVALPVTKGNNDYFKWISGVVGK